MKQYFYSAQLNVNHEAVEPLLKDAAPIFFDTEVLTMTSKSFKSFEDMRKAMEAHAKGFLAALKLKEEHTSMVQDVNPKHMLEPDELTKLLERHPDMAEELDNWDEGALMVIEVTTEELSEEDDDDYDPDLILLSYTAFEVETDNVFHLKPSATIH